MSYKMILIFAIICGMCSYWICKRAYELKMQLDTAQYKAEKRLERMLDVYFEDVDLSEIGLE